VIEAGLGIGTVVGLDDASVEGEVDGGAEGILDLEHRREGRRSELGVEEFDHGVLMATGSFADVSDDFHERNL
jgi:hypothetical protein